MYEEGDTVTCSVDVWCHFLSHHEHLLVSLWDMVPPNLIIKEIEWIPFNNGPLYLFEYAGTQFYLYEYELIPVEEETNEETIYRDQA
jgi:hypothetical protein